VRRTRRQPDIGRRLRSLLSEAAFVDIVATAAPRVVGTIEAAADAGKWNSDYFTGEPFIAEAIAQDWATAEEMAAAASAWREWGSSPSAFTAHWWCEATARVR
jgi:hypothetical protein